MQTKLYTFRANCAGQIVEVGVISTDYNNAFVAAAEKATHYVCQVKALEFVKETDVKVEAA